MLSVVRVQVTALYGNPLNQVGSGANRVVSGLTVNTSRTWYD